MGTHVLFSWRCVLKPRYVCVQSKLLTVDFSIAAVSFGRHSLVSLYSMYKLYTKPLKV